MRSPDRGSTTGAASWTDHERSESIPPHRHHSKKSSHANAGFFFACRTPQGGMRSPDRGSTTGAASWTDHERSEWAARTKTPGAFLNNACVGSKGPSNSERSESISPTAIFYVS
ncbi:hypothetical protein DFO56_101194 [Kosakonia sp. AG348]|nr:hypothetical protein DFO56_101194 [Kosakonia sp. AG348]